MVLSRLARNLQHAHERESDGDRAFMWSVAAAELLAMDVKREIDEELR